MLHFFNAAHSVTLIQRLFFGHMLYCVKCAMRLLGWCHTVEGSIAVVKVLNVCSHEINLTSVLFPASFDQNPFFLPPMETECEIYL